MWYVYLLRCADATLYCGVTTDMERRLREHNAGSRGAKYTRARRPVELVCCVAQPGCLFRVPSGAGGEAAPPCRESGVPAGEGGASAGRGISSVCYGKDAVSPRGGAALSC